MTDKKSTDDLVYPMFMNFGKDIRTCRSPIST